MHEFTFFVTKARFLELLGPVDGGEITEDFVIVIVYGMEDGAKTVSVLAQEKNPIHFVLPAEAFEPYAALDLLAKKNAAGDEIGEAYEAYKKLGWFLEPTHNALVSLRSERPNLVATAESEFESSLEELFDKCVPPSYLYPKVTKEKPLAVVMAQILEGQLADLCLHDQAKTHLEMYLPSRLEADLGL